MNKSKAAFKAVREECGLTQQDVADEADVTVQAVKKWENPKYTFNNPPDDVWRFLLDCRAALYADAHEITEKIAESYKGKKGPVRIQYYRTQADLDKVQLPDVDEPVGYTNARTRAVVLMLERAEIPVEYSYEVLL